MAESLHEGDQDCMRQLQIFEANLHVYDPNRPQ